MSAKQSVLALFRGATETNPTSILKGLGLTAEEDALYALWHAIGLVEKAIPAPEFFRVAIFGSAQIKPDDPLYSDAKWLACHIASAGIDIITGGGPGIMEAANAGAIEGKGNNNCRSIGLPIPLSTEQRANAFLSNEYLHHSFFTRLHHFARFGRVFVVMPGGIGSLLELATIWQLLQRGHMTGVPLIVVGDMWSGLIEWMTTTMVARGYVKQEEMKLVTCVPYAADALSIVLAAHQQFKLAKAS